LKRDENERDEEIRDIAADSRDLMPFGFVDRTPDGTHPQNLLELNLNLNLEVELELGGDRTSFRSFPGFRTRQDAAPISTTTERRTTERRTK
jgi:hypothetical protein